MTSMRSTFEDSTPLRMEDFADLPASRQGSQSVVSVRGRRSGARVLKRAALGRGLTLGEAQAAVDNLSIYRNELRLGNWNLPNETESRIIDDGKGIEVWIIEQFVSGGDLASLTFRDRRAQKAIGQIVGTVGQVVSRTSMMAIDTVTTLSIMPYGVDLKPRNIVCHPGTGVAWLVDTFPPLNFAESGSFAFYTPKVHKFSQEMLVAVCASHEGSLLRFWRLLERQWELEASALLAARKMFREILLKSAIRPSSIETILFQIDAGYPLLDSYYLDHQEPIVGAEFVSRE